LDGGLTYRPRAELGHKHTCDGTGKKPRYRGTASLEQSTKKTPDRKEKKAQPKSLFSGKTSADQVMGKIGTGARGLYHMNETEK